MGTKKATKPAPVKEKPLGEFASAAADICKALTVNPPLDPAMGEEVLKKEITDLLPDIKVGDDLSSATWKTLKTLGWKDVKPPKAEPPAKTAAAKKTKAPKAKSGPSNKEVVYLAWGKGKGMTDPAKLGKKVNGNVKESTIKSWISSWNRGQNLPGCASK